MHEIGIVRQIVRTVEDFAARNDVRRIDAVVVSGDRAGDLRVRIKYAGIDDRQIRVERDYEKLIQWLDTQEKPIYMMPTYTAMLELRQKLVQHCGGTDFWEG